jgi:hypothetical protein
MKKGFLKFQKFYKFKGRSFEEGDIISIDELQLSREELKSLITEKIVLPCDTRAGITFGDTITIRKG